MATAKTRKRASIHDLKNRRNTKSRGGGRKPPKRKRAAKRGGGLEVYFRYDYLLNSTLAEILGRLEIIKDLSISKYYTDRNLQLDIVPRFTIAYVATGNSIVLRFGGSVVPKIKKEGKDYVFEVHRNIALPVIVGHFLLLGYNQYLDVQNKRKDSTLKDIEIELKKIELEEKREERDAERIHRENDVDTATLHFFQYIQSRTEITYFRIDGKQIKPIQGPQP